jgi:exopolyphosphatase / guanosine-5'-triphosphate,3'-diphosphate pyrophosphatase
MATETETFAAIDLGSNSFHLIVANSVDKRIQVIDKLKDTVRLAGGLDENHKLTDESMACAMECLTRFGQRIKDIPPDNIRAVGTNTLRQAKNSPVFLKKARQTLGHPVEIISGREESRLIFLGVAYGNYNDMEQRLVIDIGGGSTELAIGRGYHAHMVESLYIGCVNMSNRFFPRGEITAKKMRKAILFARQEFEPLEIIYKRVGWDSVYGSSGTIQAVRDIFNATDGGEISIKPANLFQLKDEVIAAGHTDKLKLHGLVASRAPVFAGGIAILCAAFEALDIQNMHVSDAALREGLVLDLIGRQHDQDIRDKTVNELMTRYNVDVEHAARVEQTALGFFNQASKRWSLDVDTDMKMLRWAAKLHEIGLAIAHSQHHKHAAYLIANSELAGFSREEQSMLAALIKCHRRKLTFQEEMVQLPEELHDKLYKLSVLIRLSVVINRGRTGPEYSELNISVGDAYLKIDFPDGWLSQHPLTEADLATETDYLSVINFDLKFS